MSDIDESKEKKGLTRRAFLGHAAVGAAGVAVGSSVLGVPSALASGSDWSQVDAENIVWDRETDVLVIGSGYAAFCAAIEAYDAGATDIVIIEKAKADALGGNSILCAGSAQFGGTYIEEAQGIVDSDEFMYQDSLAWGDYRANKDVLRAVTSGSNDTVKWLESLGLVFNTKTSFQYGMRTECPRTHSPAKCPADRLETDPKWYPGSGGISYWYIMYQALKSRGITLGDRLLAEHKAVRFIQAGADGPVVGVEVQDIAGGKTLNIRTRRAVFIGAGGWKSNVAMRTNWDPRLDEDFGAGGLPYVETTGEMIMAANDIGADLTGMDFVCEYRVKWGTQKYQNWTNDLKAPTSGAGLTVPTTYDKAICVGADGKRFIDEYTSNLIDAQDFCEAFACMPKPRAVWAIMDSASATATPQAWKDAWTKAQTAEDHNATPCVWKSMIQKADTIKELAALMGVDPDTLDAEVTKYNGFVAAAKDDDFARPAAHMAAPIAIGPFYAVKAQFFAHDQMSGITVNVPGQVVKRAAHVGPTAIPLDQQEVIPRLYAAGECCGGYFGNERGHGKIGALMNIARKVGKNAAAEAPIGVKPTTLAIKTNHATALHGRSVTLSGLMSGVEGVPTGAQVNLQVRVPGTSRYATVAGPMTMAAARTVSKSYKLAKKGTYSFRMQFAGTPSFAPCASKAIKVVSK